jgi:16S rRNA (uracil1498-N3)-methyltransferase
VVERGRRPVVATFYVAGALDVGAVVTLGDDAAHHMHVRRLATGQRVGIVNGTGGAGGGTLVRLGRFDAEVAIDETWQVARPGAAHLIVPIADRDRMLWLAEKSTELGATSWRPAAWRRSRSVSPRGEGPRFHEKIRARMVAALEQSGGAWLPEIFPDAEIADAVRAAEDGTRLWLDRDAGPLLPAIGPSPVTIVVGPEGGVEDDERDQLVRSGFRAVSVGESILRFETAGVAALATVRAALQRVGTESTA